jgi:transglutaminase-like putative cysteine protease
LGRSLALIAMATALLAVAWLELEREREGLGDVVAVIGLAIAPALALLFLRRRLVALVVFVLAFLTAASVAFEIPLTDMRPRSERDFFGPLFGAMGDGFRDIYDTDTPFSPADHPELAGLVLLGIFGFTAACALLVVARRPLLSGIVLLVGVGAPATIAATAQGSSPLRTGALVLGALLVLLFVTRRSTRPLRGLGPALTVGGLVVLVSVAASTSGAVAKEAFVAWERWDFYDKPTDPVGVRYVWASNYGGITFPDKETVVLRIKAPNRSLYWRATTLDEYTGVGWREAHSPQRVEPNAAGEIVEALSDPSLPRSAQNEERWTRQDVTVVALADTHLIAAAHPVKWRNRSTEELRYARGGLVFQPDGLTQGQTYTVWSYAPPVKPSELAELPARYSDSLGRFLEVVPDVRFPAFGEGDRDRLVEELFADRSFDTLLARYEPLYRQARELIGDEATPYVAAATLETWFRSEGGFVYDEQPVQPLSSEPPLVDFVLRGKAGYCQHYAGAMAVMLRLLGIPARVAVGFTSGEYDDGKGEWTVTDHNAHAWVEVYFPRYGWLPFDPTPGRGQLGASYSTASTSFPVGGPAALGIAPDALTAILRQRLLGAGAAVGVPGGGSAATAGDDGGGGLGVAGLVFAILGSVVALVLGVKALRRALRFFHRDARGTATACRRDLIAFLADQGVSVAPSVTLEELGVFVEKIYRVNATPFVRAASAARFGTPGESDGAARRARRELRTLLRQLRRELSRSSRAIGALRLRSLAV